MANLEKTTRNSWKAALQSNESPWIAFGLNGRILSRAERLAGMAGLIDWLLHGQVSKLLSENRLAAEDFCLIPGSSAKGSSFLLYQYGETPSVPLLAGRLKQLNILEICLSESTFPEDFLAKLKQTLKKEGIRCTKLEPGNS